MHTGVIIYEDNKNLRESLGNLIANTKDLVMLCSYSNADSVVTQTQDLQPDVILMDIDMPGMNGIEAVRQIRKINERVQIIMLTVFDDNDHVLDAICAGASGYLLKKFIPAQLLDSIRLVLAGEAPMSPGIARLVVNRMQHISRPAVNLYQLTQRENEILVSLSNANSYKMIAADLAISLHTVQAHIKKIYEKLQVHSQAEAVSKAFRERLI